MTIAAPAKQIQDDYRKWSSNFQLAPFFDRERYQDRINEVAGLTTAMEPVLKLVWGGNESVFVVEGSEMVEKPRHALLSRQSHNFGELIPIRRWFIVQNTDPGQLAAMGGKNHGRLKVKETGFYEPWLIIADHSKCKAECGIKLDFDKMGNIIRVPVMCYGDYKEPDDAILAYIKEVTFKIAADKYRADPRKMVVPEMIVPYMPKVLDWKEEEEKEEQENAAYVKDWLKTHGVGRVSNQKPS